MIFILFFETNAVQQNIDVFVTIVQKETVIIVCFYPFPLPLVGLCFSSLALLSSSLALLSSYKALVIS